MNNDHKLIRSSELEWGVWNRVLVEMEPHLELIDINTANLIHRIRSGKTKIFYKEY